MGSDVGVLVRCLHMFLKAIASERRAASPYWSERIWLKECNPKLADLITENIGGDWVKDLSQLKQLLPLEKNAGFCQRWAEVKQANKSSLADFIFINTIFFYCCSCTSCCFNYSNYTSCRINTRSKKSRKYIL